MKRVIINASSTADVEFEINLGKGANVDENDLKSDILDILNNAGASKFVKSVTVNLGNLSVCDIRVFSKQTKVAQCRVTAGKIPNARCIDNLLRKLKEDIFDFVARNEKYANSDVKVMQNKTAALIRRLIKSEFGETPTYEERQLKWSNAPRGIDHEKWQRIEYHPQAFWDRLSVEEGGRVHTHKPRYSKDIEDVCTYITEFLVQNGVPSDKFFIEPGAWYWVDIYVEK